jgi:predicted dehydrogenase
MTADVRLAVVGAGAIAQVAHLPVLSKMRGARLVALCDNDRAKARALADRFAVPDVFADIDDLFAYEEIDAVVIATPNHLHEPHVLEALAAGIDVLCERPLSLHSRGVEGILAAAAAGGRKVLVGNNHRFRSDVQALDRFLRGGELGTLNGIRAGSYHTRGLVEGWRLRRAESGGGALLEHGFPLLDLALWIADFPPPQRVWAHMRPGRAGNEVEQEALVTIECATGVAFTVDVSWSYVGSDDRWWFEALSSRGSARLAPLRVLKEINGKAVDVSPMGAAARESAFIQSYRAELAHFLAVARGESTYEPPADQVVVHRIVEAAYRSADEGCEIRL